MVYGRNINCHLDEEFLKGPYSMYVCLNIIHTVTFNNIISTRLWHTIVFPSYSLRGSPPAPSHTVISTVSVPLLQSLHVYLLSHKQYLTYILGLVILTPFLRKFVSLIEHCIVLCRTCKTLDEDRLLPSSDLLSTSLTVLSTTRPSIHVPGLPEAHSVNL